MVTGNVIGKQMGRPKVHDSATERVRVFRAKSTGNRFDLTLSSDASELLRGYAGSHGLTPAKVVELLVCEVPYAQIEELIEARPRDGEN